MPYVPLTPPFWTVPAWNPDVNEARAAGEYPTAAWANQLQALHDAEVGKINEVGADLDAVSTAVGIVADPHPAGSVFTAGGDGLIKATSPGTSLQVLSWDAGSPDVAVKVDALTSPWTALTLNGSYVDVSAANGVDVLKARVHDRRVEVVGCFDTAAVNAVTSTIATLAPAMRPPTKRFMVGAHNGSTNIYSDTSGLDPVTFGRITVNTNGTLTIRADPTYRYWWVQDSFPLD